MTYKKIFFALILLLNVGINVSAQKSLLVTDFYFNSLWGTISEERIPDYFLAYPEQTRRLKHTLDSLCKIRYGATVHYFDQGPKFIHRDTLLSNGMVGYSEQMKGASKNEAHDFYLRIRSYVESRVEAIESSEMQLVLSAKAIHENGKKLFKRTVKLPFKIIYPDTVIHNSTLVDDKTFFDLYETGLKDLFTEQKVRREAFAVVASKDESYEEFCKQSIVLNIIESVANRMEIVDLKGENILSAKIKMSWQGESESDQGLIKSQRVKQKFTLKNSHIAKPWKGKFSSSSNKLLGALEIGGCQIDVKLKTGNNLQELIVLAHSSMKGTIDETKFEFANIGLSSLTRVLANDQLVALIQSKGKKPISGKDRLVRLMLLRSDSQHLLPEIVNALLIFYNADFVLADTNEED